MPRPAPFEPDKPERTPAQRGFLVGTARGGTTLLQSMLAAHPAVYTLPETHFWDYSLPKQPWLRRFLPISAAHRDRVEAFLAELEQGKAGMGRPSAERPGTSPSDHGTPISKAPTPGTPASTTTGVTAELMKLLPGTPTRDTTAWTRGLFTVLDSLAAQADKSLWLEKTPLHLYYTELFRAADPDVRIVHLLRDPVDQVASLVDAGTKHGEAFRQSTVAKAWKRWKKEYRMQRKQLGQAGHHFVLYEDLVDYPEPVLRAITGFLGLPWNPAVLDHTSQANAVIASGEAWKERNTGSRSRSGKAQRVLSAEDREWIRRKAAACPLAPFRTYTPGLP